jgi:hypothetical protein
MHRKQIIRLQELVNALHDYIHSIEWEDLIEPCSEEIDYSFDHHPEFCEDCHDDRDRAYDDHPDETDFGPVGPLCVECGNYGQSCVC